MTHRQLEAWKKFIHGRIAQEQGHEEEGLKEFEQALEFDPDNQDFRNASDAAQRNLDRNLSQSEENLLAHIKQSYEEISGTQKDQRIDGFKRLLAELEGRPPIGGFVRTYKGGLHSGWSNSQQSCGSHNGAHSRS